MEKGYRDALEKTRQMSEAARQQDWDSLVALGGLRAQLLAALPSVAQATPPIDTDTARRIAGVIAQIEEENRQIIERVEAWQKHVQVWLRIDRPEVS